MKTVPVIAAVLLAGCAFGDFTPYSGQQQNWPTQPGSFVSTKYVIPAYIHSWPDRPYTVLGYLDATTRQSAATEQFHSRRGELKSLAQMRLSSWNKAKSMPEALVTAALSLLEISTTTVSPRPPPERDFPLRCFSGKLKYSRSSGNKRLPPPCS